MTSTMFGTPSYPSPLDRIRTGRRDRAQQLGLTPHLDISFDANQSFPKTCRPQLKNDSTPIIKTRKSLFKGTGLNDVSFSAGHSRGSFSNSPDRSANTSLGESWSFYNYVGGGLSGISFPTALRNPNKAIFTINAHTSEILMANEMACEMFEYEESELIGMRLEEMIQLKHKDQRSVTETHLEASGDIVEICGKVVDILDSYGQLLPVSLWVKPLGYEGDEPRCLVVMEPVERTVATVEFDTDGTILSCDDQLAHLHGYRHPGDVEGMKMNQLIPSFKCPTVGKRMSKDVRKQRATGRTRDGATFPLSIALKLVEEFTDGVQANVKRTPLRTRSQNQEGREGLKIREPQPCEKEVYVGVIWVFANIQGMITFLPDGTIYSINENFALMLFGYTQQELIGMHISDLIPDFIEVIQGGVDSISIPPSDEDSPQIGPHLNQSDPMVRCSLPNRKIEGEPRHSPISSNVSKQSKWGLGPASLFTGPGVTSTPSRSPATTAKGLHNTDLLLKTASEIVGQSKDVKPCDQPPLSLDLGQSDSPHQSHESSVSSDTSSKTPTTVRENYRGHPSLSSLSPISMPEKIKKTTAQTEKPESPVSLLKSTEHQNKISERDLNKNNQQGAESPVWNTMELLAAKIPTLDIVSSSSDTDSDQIQKISASRSVIGVSRSKQDAEKEDARKSANCSEWLSQNAKVSLSDPNLRLSFPASPGKTDRVASPLCGSKMYKRQRRSHGGRLQNTSVCGSGGQIPDYGQKRVSEVSQAGMDGDSGRFSMSQNPLEVMDGSRCHADRRSTNQQAPGKENRPGSSPVTSRSSVKTKMASTSFSAVPQRINPLPVELNSPNVFHQSLDHGNRPEDFEVIWHKRHVPCEDDIVLEKLNQRTLSPKGGNRYFPPLQKEQPWYCKDFLSQFSAIPEGEFCCRGQHRDGTSLGISFQLKRVDLEGGNFLYAMWLSRDPREPGEGGRSFANLTLASSLNSTMETGSFSLGEALVEKAQSASKVLGDDPIKQYHYNMTNDEDDADVNTSMEEGVVSLSEGRGLYNENYDTLRCIGKGAFGFVRLARRKDNYQEVVVKFIRRSKVLSEGWVIDEDLGKCPLEISLLSQLHHDNIVKVIDVYDNEDFYQMVMEKHGSGMDLFEFIDRNPNLDEALASYLFRQIVSAVFYLHSLGILHRDIKDENVILDEEFQVKLIDFGAAAYLRPGHYFKTFCGTLEYCSPEVLMGQSYRGPELEIWSLGVTLYTLIFRENPFYDVEETIECTLKPPFVVSNTLMLLLSCMLRKDLRCRATIQEVNKHNWVNQPVDISQYSWEDVLPNSEFYGNTAADHREDSSPAEVNNYTFEFSRDKFVYHGDPEAGRHETEDFDSESESEAEELETELQRCLNLSEMNECKVYVYDDDDDNDDDEYDVDDVEGAELSEVHHDRRLFGDC